MMVLAMVFITGRTPREKLSEIKNYDIVFINGSTQDKKIKKIIKKINPKN